MITVHDEYETARRIRDGASLTRFGDGELNIAFLERPAFENYDPTLAQRLRDILVARHQGLLIGLPDIFSPEAKMRLCNPAFWPQYETLCLEKLDPTFEYHSNFFSRPDVCCLRPGLTIEKRKSAEHVDPAYWNLMRSIWEGRDICLINFNPDLARNELFDNAARVQFISCPQRNAWGGGQTYQTILDRALAVETELILAAVGPLGTVLAHDLHLAGKWAVDFGQAGRVYYEGMGREHMNFY